MPHIPWDREASLMRVTRFETSGESREELVARGTLRQLIGIVLELSPDRWQGLLLRSAGSDGAQEYDSAAIRELASRPEYTGAHGAYDTADRADDGDNREVEA
jgi:hypothetical protein